jgi:hypothetical protein
MIGYGYAPPLSRRTPWDPALRSAMSERGLAAYEESLIETLLTDVITGCPPE